MLHTKKATTCTDHDSARSWTMTRCWPFTSATRNHVLANRTGVLRLEHHSSQSTATLLSLLLPLSVIDERFLSSARCTCSFKFRLPPRKKICSTPQSVFCERVDIIVTVRETKCPKLDTWSLNRNTVFPRIRRITELRCATYCSVRKNWKQFQMNLLKQ
jgi:hypothetical protein